MSLIPSNLGQFERNPDGLKVPNRKRRFTYWRDSENLRNAVMIGSSGGVLIGESGGMVCQNESSDCSCCSSPSSSYSPTCDCGSALTGDCCDLVTGNINCLVCPTSFSIVWTCSGGGPCDCVSDVDGNAFTCDMSGSPATFALTQGTSCNEYGCFGTTPAWSGSTGFFVPESPNPCAPPPKTGNDYEVGITASLNLFCECDQDFCDNCVEDEYGNLVPLCAWFLEASEGGLGDSGGTVEVAVCGADSPAGLSGSVTVDYGPFGPCPSNSVGTFTFVVS
jgi:hypothetical protein